MARLLYLLVLTASSFLWILAVVFFFTVSKVRFAAPQTDLQTTTFPSLLDATLDDIRHQFDQGCLKSTDLVQAYMARIDQVNDQLHAVTEINPDAFDIAKSLDEERGKGVVRGPLHGIPILLKDNIATMDKMNNTAGSYALLGSTVPRDSTVVRKLREAGAVILGKANLSQWAQYRSTEVPLGWSAYGGQVYGAYHANQSPAGSSSGSAVAADLGLAFATLGTDTSGSILYPSGRNNIVGIRPTVGLTSRHLVIPAVQRQDTVGPMARTVRDAAQILQVIAGRDTRDNYTLAIPSLPDYVAACDERALSGAVIGVPWNEVENMDDNVAGQIGPFRAAVKVLEEAGATVIDISLERGDDDDLYADVDTVLAADLPTTMAAYLAELTSNPNKLHTLAQIRDFTKQSPDEGYPSRDTDTWDYVLKHHLDPADPRVWAAYQSLWQSARTRSFLGAMEEHKLSAIVIPTEVAPDWVSYVGAPAVTVPLGHYPPEMPLDEAAFEDDLVAVGSNIPFGLSFIGRPWSEAQLIGLAYSFEQKTKIRGKVKPMIMPTAEIRLPAAC